MFIRRECEEASVLSTAALDCSNSGMVSVAERLTGLRCCCMDIGSGPFNRLPSFLLTLVNSLKGVSSRMIRQKKYPSIRKKLWGGALWSPSYFAGSCGGAPISIIRRYIERIRPAKYTVDGGASGMRGVFRIALWLPRQWA